MMKVSILYAWILVLLPILYAAKLPYTFIDFNHIHRSNGLWVNDPAIRQQEAKKFDVALTDYVPTKETLDNAGNKVGVFECSKQDSMIFTQAWFPGVTYSAFSLEVIVSIQAFNIIFPGFIIGIQDTADNTQGDAISFNAMTGQTSGQPNKFFPANKQQNGWRATSDYFESTKLIQDLKVNTFYHVILSQDANGIVRVYVNGAQYGDSFTAPGGKKTNTMVFPTLTICGDGITANNIGIDARIRAFGFYKEAFNSDADAKDSCLKAAMTDCDGIERRTTSAPTPEPTASPVELCELGKNYFVEGVPATVSGDPHFKTFNGEFHDYQGRNLQQIYYMHPCPGKTRKQMPFAILGTHYKIGLTRITRLDYITFELYDEGTDKYYIWLSSSIQNYAKADGAHPLSLYDRNPGTNFGSGQQLILGKRFKFKAVKSGIKTHFTLTIRNNCAVTGFIQRQGGVVSGRYRMHYLLIMPPQCYKCYTCGLLGGFRRAPIAGPRGFLRACNGAGNFFLDNDYANPRTYDHQGWGWEKNYFERTCSRYFTTQRRLQQDDEIDFSVVYEPRVEPDFEIPNPCNGAFEAQAKQACQDARNGQSTCCTQIGGSYCDNLQEKCEFDGCLFATADGIGTLSARVNELFTAPVEFVCAIPDIKDIMDEKNLIEAPGNTQTLPPTPAPVSFIGRCPCTVLETDSCNKANNKITVSCREEDLSFDETTDAIRSCIDIYSSAVPDDITIINLIISTKFSHEYVGDLEAELQHNLIKAKLVNSCGGLGGGCSANNVDVVFNDDDDNAIGGDCNSEDYCKELSGGTGFGIGGVRKSLESLSRFDGEQANGRYALFIYDRVASDEGTFGTFSLELTLSRCPSEPAQSAYAIPNSNHLKVVDNNPVEHKKVVDNKDKDIINNDKLPFDKKTSINDYDYDYNLWEMVEINIITSMLACTVVICICYAIYQSFKYLNSGNHLQYAGVKYSNDDDQL